MGETMGGDAKVCFGGAADAGAEKSKRSPIPELFAGAGEKPGAEPKSPNPLEELKPREGCGGDF